MDLTRIKREVVFADTTGSDREQGVTEKSDSDNDLVSTRAGSKENPSKMGEALPTIEDGSPTDHLDLDGAPRFRKPGGDGDNHSEYSVSHESAFPNRSFPLDMLTPGIFPSIPVAIDERVSAACFSKVDDRYLVVFSKTDLIVYDTTYGAAPAAAGGVGAEQDGATPAAAGTQKSAGSAAVGFPRKRHSHGMNSDGDPGAASSSDDEDDADSPTTVHRGGVRVSGAGKIRVQHTRSCVSFAADADDADPEASHDTLGRISAAPSPTTRTTSRNKGDEDPGAATGEPALVHEMSSASAVSASSGNLSTKAARKHARRLQHQAIADAKSAGDSEITIRPAPRVWPVIKRIRVVSAGTGGAGGNSSTSATTSSSTSGNYGTGSITAASPPGQHPTGQTMSITLEERKKIIYNSRTHLQHKLALKAAYCFALTFSADDSLLAVGLMQGFSQLCTVYIYDTSTWTLVKKLPRCNAVEFFPKAEIVPGIDTSKWICVQDLAELRNEVLDAGDNFSSVASWYSTTLDVSRLKRKAAPVVISPDAQFVVTTRTAYALARQERVISLDADDDSGVQMRFLFMDFSRKESAGKKLSAATGPFLFAAVMQVQGENKIYIYAVDDWTDRKDENGDLLHPHAGKSRKHPIMRLYEPNVTYHGVRFVNSDRSLTSYGDDTGGLGSSGIRFWCTETWALTHIVPDGTAELFPYCCGWTNGWLFVLPNRRKQAEEREQLGSRFGDARARAYKGYTARCYDYSGGASKVTQKVVHLGRSTSNGQRNGASASARGGHQTDAARDADQFASWNTNGHGYSTRRGGSTTAFGFGTSLASLRRRMSTAVVHPALQMFGGGTSNKGSALMGFSDVDALHGQTSSSSSGAENVADAFKATAPPGVMAFTQQLYISGNVFVKAKDSRLANRFLILGHDHTISVHDLMADPPRKGAGTSSSGAHQLAEDAGDSPEHDGPEPVVHQQFSLVTLPNDPDADWAEMEQESDKSFYVLDAVLVLSSPSSDAVSAAGQQDAQHGSAGAPRGRLLLSAVMGIEGGRASRVGNEIGIFEIPLSEKIFADALTQLNSEQLGAATAAEENEGGGGDAGARPESKSPAAAPEYHKVISCSEDDLATITDPRSIPKLKSVTSFKACEKFFAEKQSVKGRFSSDGRLFFANCVQPDEAHMYLVPAAGTNTGGSSALDSSPTPSDAREDGSSTTQASNKLPSPLVQMIGDDNEIVEIGRYHRENWECQIIFDRTYTSGQPLFSPDSRWFAYNGELYDTEDWTCVSDEWSEADIRCDRDTITGRYLSNDIFIADSSEGNEKGLLQIYRLQRAGGGGGNANAFRSAATVLAGRATGAARAAGVDPGAAIPSTAGLPLSSPVVKSTSFVDVMATALDRSSTAASPERGGRDEDRDVRADADAAAPSGVMSSGTGYLGLRAAIMRHHQKKWIFDRKIGNRKALRHLFAHFDEIVTMEGNWLAVSDPGTMTAIYDMDAGLELCFATPCKKSRGLLGCMRVASGNGSAPAPHDAVATSFSSSPSSSRRKAPARNKATATTTSSSRTAGLFRCFFSDGNGNLYRDFNVPFLHAVGTPAEAMRCLLSLDDSEPNKQIRLNNLREKKRSLLMRWTRSFPGFLNQVDAVSRKSLLYLAIEAGEKQTATCIFEAVAALNVKLSLHARYNLKLLKLGPSKFADLSLLADDQDEDGGQAQESKSVLPTGRASVSSFAVEDYYTDEDVGQGAFGAIFKGRPSQSSMFFPSSFFPNKASGGGNYRNSTASVFTNGVEEVAETRSASQASGGIGSASRRSFGHGGGSGTGFFEQEDVDLTPRTTSKLAGKMIVGKTKALKRSLHSLGARSAGLARALNNGIGKTSIARLKKQLGLEEREILRIKEENELSLAIRLHERDLTHLFIERILEEGFTQTSLPLVWNCLPALLKWVPAEAEKVLEAFVIEPPFVVPELKAFVDPASRLISKGTDFYGYQMNVWADYLEQQGSLRQHDLDAALEPMTAKVLAIPEMVSGSGDGQGLLTLLMECNVPSSFYASTPARILINYKWEAYARDELQMYFVTYVLFLLSYTMFAIYLRERLDPYDFEPTKDVEHQLVAGLTLVFYLGCMTYRYFDFPEFWRVARVAFCVAQRICSCRWCSRTSKSAKKSEQEQFLTANTDPMKRSSSKVSNSSAYGGGAAGDGKMQPQRTFSVLYGQFQEQPQSGQAVSRDASEEDQQSRLVEDPKSSYTLLRRHAPFYLPLLFYVSVAFILEMNNRGDLLHTAVLTILYSYTLRSFVDEVQELRQKTLAHYVQSIWNLFDVTLCVLNVLTFIAYATATRDGSRLLDGYLIRAVTMSVLMAWIKIFYFCQPFRNLGSFIRMLIEIFYDIRYFLIVVLISLFQFGTAFYVLYKDDWVRQIHLLEGSNISGNLMKGTVLPANERKLLLERDWPQDLPTAIPAVPGGAAQVHAAAAPRQQARHDVLATQHEVERLTSTPYPNLWHSVLNMYVVMLGTFEIDNFTMTEHSNFATFLFFLFTFEVMIILLNLLIAIMSDTFERVRENEQNTFLRTRADMICDLQKLTFRSIRYDKWVHALLPIETEQSRQGAWKGKLGEIKDLIKHLKVDFAKELEVHLTDLEEKLTGAV